MSAGGIQRRAAIGNRGLCGEAGVNRLKLNAGGAGAMLGSRAAVTAMRPGYARGSECGPRSPETAEV